MTALTQLPHQSVRDRFFMLRSLHSLSGLDDEGFSILAEHTKSRFFEKGALLLEEGKPVERVQLVVQGLVEVTRKGKLLAKVDRAHGVGMVSTLARDPEGAKAVALEDTQTLELPVGVLLSAYETNFSFLRNTLRLSANGLLKKRGNLPVRPERAQPAELGEYVERSETLVERIIEMSKAPLFASANIEAVIDLARRYQELRVEPGHLFWDVGDLPSFNLRVKYGRVKCSNAEGEEVVVGAGFVLGALDPLGDMPRSYRAEAETKVIAFRGDKDHFLSALETHHEVAMELLATFARAHLEESSQESSR